MSTPGKSAGRKSVATSNKSSGKKKNKDISTGIGRFAVPSMKNLKLDEKIVEEFALKNDYATMCGALDINSHPMTRYIIEEGLLTKRNEEGKTPFDLAATIGNKEFIRAILERIGEKLNETEFNIGILLNPSVVSYNFMHHACIWGRMEICKVLVLYDNTKLIKDPSETVETDAEPKMLPLAGVMLKTKSKYGETPKDIAIRYNHFELTDFLTYAEKRQYFLDGVKKVEQFTKQPESDYSDPLTLRKFKDSRKKLEKFLTELAQWLDENKDIFDINFLIEKMLEIDEFCTPLMGSIFESKE